MKPYVLGCLVALFTLAFCDLYLRSPEKWWHEDDPFHFAGAAAIDNPVDIFVDPIVMHRWGTGASLVPMHILSFWTDTHMFGISPRVARVHHLVSTILVTVLIFVVLARFGLDPLVAAAAAALWLCLPSTVAVHYNLGTRQYLEGLGWSLVACDQARRLCEPPPRKWWSATALLVISSAAAMLSKEIYAATVPLFLFLYALARRRYGLSGLAIGLAAGYYGYRLAILGADPSYPHSRLTIDEYLRYLGTLPYTLSVSPLGWAVVAALAVLAVAAMRRDPSGWRPVLLILGVIVAGLAATSPTASAVLMTYDTPGTWYRAVFMFQTTVLIAGAYLLGRFSGRVVHGTTLLIVLAVVIPGTAKTRSYWLGRLAESEAEGRFYLAHPDRLVYSEEPAYWFLPGLDKLYGVPSPHSLGRYDPSQALARQRLDHYSTIWRRRDGSWVEDGALYAEIRERLARMH